MKQTVTAILNSRKRPDGLRRLVNSLLMAQFDMEIVVRIDNDDRSYDKTYFPPNVKLIVGPRYLGWKSSHLHLKECAYEATGDWLFQLNDDAYVSGTGWVQELAKVPREGFIVQAKYHKLGESHYMDQRQGAFPIIPNKCWEKLHVDLFQHPYDKFVDEALRNVFGWETRFLENLKTIHERPTDAELDEHRA